MHGPEVCSSADRVLVAVATGMEKKSMEASVLR